MSQETLHTVDIRREYLPIVRRIRLRALRRVRWLRDLWEKTAWEGGQGMMISHAEVDRILADPTEMASDEKAFYEGLEKENEQIQEADCEAAQDPRWVQLCGQFGLSEYECDLLSLALASEILPSLRRVFGYLNDDAAACHPNVHLAANLFDWLPGHIIHADSPLIEWRLRDLSKPEGTVVMKNLPTCANCHSFSKDGHVLGLDMDGPSGDKGAYAIAPVAPRMVITGAQVMTWNAADPARGTFGMFSRVSPDGRFVVSTIRESLFVQNYLDFRFLQTFYPTRGILAVYDRDMDTIKPLPGADDQNFVQTNAVWTPDERRLIFLRAPAVDNVPPAGRPVKANDPNEIQIRYDLYTIPFAGGRGGTAEPLRGASNNGMSNSFPAVSPDGHWIVWVQAAAGLLMRPDSALYIMPLNGGRARRMSCNLFPMNSWHSWSPNSRWLVFSSKANTPYTQLFLTHIDEEGNDSPAILIPHSTAANRAANIPEFAAIAPDGIQSIQTPAVDYKRHVDRGLELIKARRLDEAFDELKAAEEMKPDYPETLAGLGYYFREKGDLASAVLYFEKALAIEPRNWEARNIYGVTLFRQRKYDEALKQFEAAIAIDPINSLSLANSLANIAAVALAKGDTAKAGQFYEKAISANPQYLQARTGLAALLVREGRHGDAAMQYEKFLQAAPDDMDVTANLAWLYATCPEAGARNGTRALELGRKLLGLARTPTARIFDIMAAAFAESGQFADAVSAATRSLEMTPPQDPMYEDRQALLELYKSGKPHHRKK